MSSIVIPQFSAPIDREEEYMEQFERAEALKDMKQSLGIFKAKTRGTTGMSFKDNPDYEKVDSRWRRAGEGSPDGERPYWTAGFKATVKKIQDNNSTYAPYTSETAARVEEAFPKLDAKKREEIVSYANKYVEDNPVTYQFSIYDVLDKWLEDPRTKNYRQSDLGYGTQNEERRTEAERWIVKYGGEDGGLLDGMADDETPTYGLLDPDDGIRRGHWYGMSFLKLKDSVKDRATFSFGDSTNSTKNKVDRNDKERYYIGSFARGNADVLFDEERYATAGLVKDEYNRFKAKSRNTYMETQIWGGISLKDDVESIHIGGDELYKMSDGDKAKLARLAETTGLKVYNHGKEWKPEGGRDGP